MLSRQNWSRRTRMFPSGPALDCSAIQVLEVTLHHCLETPTTPAMTPKPYPHIVFTLECNCSIKRCRDMALYIYLRFYNIVPTLFACSLAYHPYIFLHSQPYYKDDLFSLYSYTVTLVTAVHSYYKPLL